MKAMNVVMFSGGIGSWATAKRVAEQYGTKDLVLLFSDVQGNTNNPHIGEDPDTYRFINDAAANVGGELVVLNEGRDIWQVFTDKRFLGNSRLANCSHELKQKPARKWINENCDPETTRIFVGIDWTEIHRLEAIERNYKPFKAYAPMIDEPRLTKTQMIEWAEREGLRTPNLYRLGFAHNNCGGGVCVLVKANSNTCWMLCLTGSLFGKKRKKKLPTTWAKM
jgi:3'-phosphoadenosine 5'-phosphosulfate sulfotransferase (PAPS reductase)/FAD synthetase